MLADYFSLRSKPADKSILRWSFCGLFMDAPTRCMHRIKQIIMCVCFCPTISIGSSSLPPFDCERLLS